MDLTWILSPLREVAVESRETREGGISAAVEAVVTEVAGINP